jgi:hypothetical protein
MPYLATTIRQARASSATVSPSPVLLIDLGGVWASDAYICQVTENRAPYLILDAMGYHVARADGLDVGGILGLRESVQVTLMDDSVVYRWHSHGITINVGPKGETPAITWPLVNTLSPTNVVAESANGRLMLYAPDGYLGKVEAQWPSMTIERAERIPFDRSRPDPSIIEMVKFVEYEARAYERRQKGDQS